MNANKGVKIFNCPVHGHIELSPLSVRIIDTPQFQRLRDIAQLGGVYFVFPGASHKRFEHSLGVAHLARTFVNNICKVQPELHVTYADALCVEIAGLCHDLGHGPFSHLFDGRLLPRLGITSFTHEQASIEIFKLLVEENGLMAHFATIGLTQDDVHFIEELILGSPTEAPTGYEWVGRGEKDFLYDIVANKRNGIDVDKFDYFARDCKGLNITQSFDFTRLMKFARVYRPDPGNSSVLAASAEARGEGKLQICYHYKEAWNIFEMFHTRYQLHLRAYQHKVAIAVELMITEALAEAEPYFFVPGKDNIPRRISQCINDMHAYWRLSDSILQSIKNSFDENLAPSRAIIQRLQKRDLFRFAGETLILPQSAVGDELMGYNKRNQCGVSTATVAAAPQQSEHGTYVTGVERVKREIMENYSHRRRVGKQLKDSSEEAVDIDINDIFINVIKMSYGKGGLNPVSELTHFYWPDKSDDVAADRDATHGLQWVMRHVDHEASSSFLLDPAPVKVTLLPPVTDFLSRLIPHEFEEYRLRIYCRYKEQVAMVNSLFQEWCHSRKLLEQVSSSESCTPTKPKKPKR